MSFGLWSLYGGWGATSTLVDTTVLDLPLTFYPTLWGSAIAVCALAAACAILSSFLTPADEFDRRIVLYRLEAWAITVMAGFIVVYPITQIGAVFAGDWSSLDTVFLGASYLVYIAYRAGYLFQRAREVKLADKVYREEMDG